MKKSIIASALFVFAATVNAQSSYFGIEGGAAFADIKADETAQYLANASGRTTSYTYDKGTGVARMY
jgi:hypothetical protein